MLLLTGLLPLFAAVAVWLLGIVWVLGSHIVRRAEGPLPFKSAVLAGLPWVIIIVYLVCPCDANSNRTPLSLVLPLFCQRLPQPSRSESPCAQAVPTIAFTSFSTFNCRSYDDDTALGTKQSFMHYDPSVRCWSGQEHKDIMTSAVTLAFLWPVGGTLFCAALLYASHDAIKENTPTPLSRATAFLHREFNPNFSFWEGVRYVLCGSKQ